MPSPSPVWSDADLLSLQQAVACLEAPSLTLKITQLLGSPLEKAMARLPDSARAGLQQATRVALEKAVHAAFATLSSAAPVPQAEAQASVPGRFSRWRPGPARLQAASELGHKVAVGLSGAVGGWLGPVSTLAELPASTLLILRAIADVARSEGADLNDPAVKTECLTVFALGSPSPSDDATESAYYAARTATAWLVREAGAALGQAATQQWGGSVAAQGLAKVIEAVASRLGVVITEKVAAQSVPVLGAVAGAALNTLFMAHFQSVARGHFVVKRLEARYGPEAVQAAYLGLSGTASRR
ncbi:EcsC family protein [Curvibacter sp. RS43]|uniref:EcsC family protein n=1 Tax=Curvibacter microcysteis TaxID=3026419 RepID=A0ABT5MIZ9_9BURK|nr:MULTISPECIES: EcsC family protein [unclassified Curvibacter]MDD0811794.1 EcsC family protein [Curvibacter sp. RS43]MDD0816560.1 EcsC family protein [Curvibacter sp. HBC28]